MFMKNVPAQSLRAGNKKKINVVTCLHQKPVQYRPGAEAGAGAGAETERKSGVSEGAMVGVGGSSARVKEDKCATC